MLQPSHSRNQLLSTVKQVCCQSIAQLTHLIPVPIACYPFLSFESFHPHFQTRTHTFKPVRVFGKPTLLILTVPDNSVHSSGEFKYDACHALLMHY